MISTKKINNEIINVIPVQQLKESEILGYSLLPKLYCNIFLCARKGSGKTNIIYKIIQKCINQTCKIIVFASTHEIDDNWKYIKKYLEEKNITAIYYSSIEDVTNKTNNLESIMQFMKEQHKLEEEEIANQKEDINQFIKIIKFDEKKGFNLKIMPKKKESPKYLIIFDDMSISLKKRNVSELLKTFRHYHSKVIISSQYFNDIAHEARDQIDCWILFKGQTEDKIDDIHKAICTHLPKEVFSNLYKIVTNEKYNFLYVFGNEFRKNFNELIEINNIN